MVYTVGLTGGIASGKSAVGQMFSELGITVVDADMIAHALSAPGQAGYEAIKATFGERFLTKDKTLDRNKMRLHFFEHAADKQKLEACLHPLIRIEIQAQIEAATSDYVVVCIPLLAESNMASQFSRILVVDIPEDLQMARLAARDPKSCDVHDDIVRSQYPREKRLAIADDVICNDGDFQQLKEKVFTLHQFYLKQVNHDGS